MSVVVLGSVNADLVLDVARIPAPGETVLATGSRRSPGGKGANQAVAAARSGATTVFVGAVGTDIGAAELAQALRTAGVDTSCLRHVDGPSGLAVVVVDEDGANSIVVAPGANGTLADLTAADERAIAAARILLAQLEIPLPAVLAGARAARAAGCRVVLNAAPAQPLPDELWVAVDLLVVNETEAAELSGQSAGDPDGCASALLDRVPAVVITLGAAGVLHRDRSGARTAVPAPRVEAVDTTAAGDTFCGVLAAALARGDALVDALRRAVSAASLAVQRPGAVPSIPTAAEIDAAARR